MYQCQKLKQFDQAVQHFTSHYQQYCISVTSCLKSRLEWSNLEFIRDVIFFLASQGWQKIIDEEDKSEIDGDTTSSDQLEAINRLTSRFKVPLEAAGADIGLIVGEFHEMLLYATQFISLSSTNYQIVWWKLFHSPNATMF